VPTLNDLVRARTAHDAEDLAWLHLLIADWQIIADLSFADLVLWLPDRDGSGFWAGAQMRPTTGPTAFVDDLVGTFVRAGERPLLDSAYSQRRVAREGDPEWRDDIPVRVEAIPVRREDRILAVVARNTNLLGVRTPSRLELAYLQTATDLTQMISDGSFPFPGQRSDHIDSPRVGDGFVRIDATGRVTYASPNALSVYRRLGLSTDLTGLDLAEVTRDLVRLGRRLDEETLSAVLEGRSPKDTEIGNEYVALILRAIPLRPAGEHEGALVLLRDVTDLRSRDRELMTKDATIREIHHRVKNNLQTVAALLRLQARRIGVPEGRAALEEAVRRVGSIAIVHETLSQAFDELVDFDEVADRLQMLVTDMCSPEAPVTSARQGTFGMLRAEAATPLAMVLTEVMQNAVEHGFGDRPGRITVTANRLVGRLQVSVEDDGVGLPEGFDIETSNSLGLSIVRTLVESELDGTLQIGPGQIGPGQIGPGQIGPGQIGPGQVGPGETAPGRRRGTRVRLDVPVGRPHREG
jgi:two-component sensor histidine kinase